VGEYNASGGLIRRHIPGASFDETLELEEVVVKATKKPKSCPAGNYYNVSFGVGALGGLAFFGFSGSFSVSVSLSPRAPIDSLQISASAQGAPLGGFGAIGSAGIQAGGGSAPCPTRPGVSRGRGITAELAGGEGVVGGVSISQPETGGLSASGGAVRLSVGLGAFAGGGNFNSITYASPFLGCSIR